MKIAVFDTHQFEENILRAANGAANGAANENQRHELTFFETRLNAQTAAMANGFEAVCCFVNDRLDEETLNLLARAGVRLIVLRSAGYNHVDLAAANRLGLRVVRVPEYSPYAVAEHAVAMLLTLNRKTHRAFNRIREMNFSLDGLVGFDLHGKTVGVIGTGKIGAAFARIMKGFGCRVLGMDLNVDKSLEREIGLESVDLPKLFAESDVISLHVPLTKGTYHLINDGAFELMKSDAILINTGRGGLVDTQALIKALKQRRIAGACPDVYEEEAGIFFSDLSNEGVGDDQLARLMTFPNVLITSHQGFLTHEALENIASTTLASISDFENGRELKCEVLP